MQARGSVKRTPKKRSGFKPSAAGKAYAAPKYTPAPSRSDAAQRHGARTPKPKPYRPTPKQVEASRIQAKAYKSQGKAVKKVSHVQKAQGVGRPTGGRTLVTRVEAAGKVRRGRRREREAKAISKLVGFDPRDRYNNTPRVTKTNVMKAPKGLEKAAKLGYLETDPGKLKTAGFTDPGWVEEAVSSPKHAIKAISNIPRDVGDLAVGTPTSLVHMGDIAQKGVRKSISEGSPTPALKAGEEIGKGVIQPYKDLAKDPLKFITEHPVTTALMVTPAGKIPGRTAGRAARVTGKQTLRREPATLPGTTIKAQRTGSRSAGRRGRQELKDEGKTRLGQDTGQKPAAPRVADKEIRKRVDEFYDLGQQHKQAAVAAAGRQVNKELPKRRRVRAPAVRKATKQRRAADKAERGAVVETKLSGARGGAEQRVDRMFAHEFGSHWRVDSKSGAIVKPKNAPEGSGVIHATRAEAQKVADTIERKGLFETTVREIEGETEGVTGGYAVVPKVAHERLRHHRRVGKSPATGAVVLRTGNRAFRKTVLPVSTKWLGGQAAEAVVRGAAQGVGPTSLLRYRRVMRELRKVDPDAARALEQRAVSGGQFGLTGPAAEFATRGKTLAEEFEPTGLAGAGRGATRVGALPGVRHARAGYRRYSDFVFNDLNGRIEKLAKQGMLGKELGPRGRSPLMERRVVGLGEKAVAEAAQGLRGTSTQIQAARAVDRAYGKYSKLGPHARETILHTTPFVPWFVNMANFLTRVLPADHPVKTGLIASMNQGDQEWRKSKRLSYYGDDRVPDWMMGAYPGKGTDKFIPVGRFGPFSPGEYVGSVGSQIAPQYTGALMNLAGVDWKGQELKGGHASQADLGLNALLTQAEAMIPGVGLGNRITGLGEHYVRGKKDKPTVLGKREKRKKVDQAIIEMLNPVRPIGLASERSSKKKKPSSNVGGSSSVRGGVSGGSSVR